MIKASVDDKEHIIDLLAAAFYDNKSVNYIIGRSRQSQERVKALMNYSFEVCFRFGEVFLSNDKHACALVLYPDKKRITLTSIWFDIQLIFRVIGIGCVIKALKREADIKKIHPKVPMLYLWFIGVHPAYQQQGSGTTLMREILALAAAANRQVYLETSTEKNLPWYDSLGFKVYDQLDLGYILYFLKQH